MINFSSFPVSDYIIVATSFYNGTNRGLGEAGFSKKRLPERVNNDTATNKQISK